MSVLILLVGLIGLVNLPMGQYPDIAPPTVMVSATYTGANAETVQKSVVVPLEEAINGVEDMLYMTSTSTNTCSGSITVYFKQGTDPDMATINTKNRVSEAEGLLPAEVTKIGVTVEKRQSSMLKIIALYSPDDSYDQTFINNYFKINIEPRLSRISGVAFPTGTLSSFDGQKTQKTYSVGASASWEIDLFGKLRNSKRQALASLLASDAYRQAMQTQVVATVADSYYALLMLDEQIRITEQTTESWREYVRSLAALMQAGQADRATLAQAEASRLAAESSLLSLQQQAIEQENALCVFVGLTPRHLERGTMDGQHFPSHLSVGVPLDLLSRRPDVRQAEANLMQAFYATNSARAAFYPSITLSGSAGWTNSGGAVVANPGAWLLQAVGSLVQPLFNRGQNLANLKIAKAQQEEAVLQFRQSLLDAGNEVNNALAQWQTARERIRLDNGQVEQLTITLGDTELLMENSADTNYLQVLTARQSLLSAQLAVASDRYDEIQGVIELYHALGGGSE